VSKFIHLGTTVIKVRLGTVKLILCLTKYHAMKLYATVVYQHYCEEFQSKLYSGNAKCHTAKVAQSV
jgi:hypothetical protein